MALSYEQQLLDAVNMSINPTQNNIQKAEDLLTKELIKDDNYGIGLLNIASNSNITDFAVRQAAAVLLDKVTRQSWNEYKKLLDVKDCLTPNCKEMLKENILNAIVACGHPKIIKLLGSVLHTVLSREFPQKMPNFENDVMTLLKSNPSPEK